MHAADFCRTVAQPSALHGLLLKYTQTLLVLTSQGVLCNRLHPLDRRLARWLLLIHDRVGRDSFALTHEYIAVMLGVRRAGVTVALSALRDAGVIEYHRGKMTVTDRPRLEAATCQCYRVCVEQIDRRPRGAPPAHTFNA